jgi:hypothetical protein
VDRLETDPDKVAFVHQSSHRVKTNRSAFPDFGILHFFSSLHGISRIAQKPCAIPRYQQRPFSTGKTAQIPDISQIRKQHGIKRIFLKKPVQTRPSVF